MSVSASWNASYTVNLFRADRALCVRLRRSCPFDYVRIYDGSSNASEPIGSYCGRWTDVTVYSTGSSMYVEFVTKSGRHEPVVVRPSHHHSHPTAAVAAAGRGVQRRGFKATFDITDRFVDLGR